MMRSPPLLRRSREDARAEMRAGFQKPHTRKGAVDLAAAHVFVGEEGSGGRQDRRAGRAWWWRGARGSLRCSLSPPPTHH